MLVATQAALAQGGRTTPPANNPPKTSTPPKTTPAAGGQTTSQPAAQPTFDPNRVIAVINGQPVKASDFYRRMEYLGGVGKVIGNSFVERTPAFWTLDSMATEWMTFQLARDKGVFPAEAEVQQELRFRLESSPTLLQDWEGSGQTRAELEYQIRFQLCQFKIATAGITVTDQEVEKFYKDNPNSFTVPRRVKLRVISVSDPAKKAQVDLQLQSGKKFDEVAKAMSEDITASSGGQFGTVPLNSLAEPIRKVIEATRVGQQTPWLDASGNSVKFLLEEIIAERVQPLDDAMKRGIRRRLMLDRGRVKNDVAKEMAAMRAKLNVDVRTPALAEEWKEYMKRMANP